MNCGSREQGTGNPGRAAGVVGSSRFPGPRSLRAQRGRGFTLLEVLAALAVLAIAFAIGLGALGKSAQNAVRGAALDTAVERAQSVLDEQGLMAPLKDETLQGKFDDGMRWTLRIHALTRPGTSDGEAVALQRQGVLLAQAGAIDIYQLDIAVQYGAGRVLRLSTQRAQAAAEPQP
jgi:general secretion pathway protein I